MNIGDKINLKNGCQATITKIGLSDFIGDAYPIYYQYVQNNKVVTDFMMSDELKKTKPTMEI